MFVTNIQEIRSARDKVDLIQLLYHHEVIGVNHLNPSRFPKTLLHPKLFVEANIVLLLVEHPV